MADIKIIVATHKKYWMPADKMYIPVHVGAEISNVNLGYTKDNTGENISRKNKNYCELTGLYWAWKNLKADYIGLAHYRRHFCAKGSRGTKQERVLTSEQAEALVRENEILVPTPRRYFIETNYSQYAHAHNAIDFDKTREILCEKYPEYVKAYDVCMAKTSCHLFNMFIMKKEKFDEYCEWLFDVLSELEKRLDISKYSTDDARVFGFVSERLLDVWLATKGYKYKEVPYIFMERQNWLKKGFNFLKRKFVGR